MFKKSFTVPVSVTLSTDRKVHAVVVLVVAADIDSKAPANVLARWTTHLRRSVGITLTVVRVKGTVEFIVKAAARTVAIPGFWISAGGWRGGREWDARVCRGREINCPIWTGSAGEKRGRGRDSDVDDRSEESADVITCASC